MSPLAREESLSDAKLRSPSWLSRLGQMHWDFGRSQCLLTMVKILGPINITPHPHDLYILQGRVKPGNDLILGSEALGKYLGDKGPSIRSS